MKWFNFFDSAKQMNLYIAATAATEKQIQQWLPSLWNKEGEESRVYLMLAGISAYVLYDLLKSLSDGDLIQFDNEMVQEKLMRKLGRTVAGLLAVTCLQFGLNKLAFEPTTALCMAALFMAFITHLLSEHYHENNQPNRRLPPP